MKHSSTYLQLLFSTYGASAANLADCLPAPIEGVSYLISHQQPPLGFPESEAGRELLNRSDVCYYPTDSRGISVNRNHCLRHAQAEVVWLLDDDVRLCPSYLGKVRDTFISNPSVDVACFRITTPEGLPYHPYSEESFQLTTIEELRNVSSIEIAFRLDSVRKANLCFDERFGIGTDWPCSEEFLFLVACLRAGLSIRYFPEVVVEHPLQSTTKCRSQYEPIMLEKSGAVNAVLYGCPWAYVRNLLSLLNAPLKQIGLSPLAFLAHKNRGTTRALRTPFQPPTNEY